MAGNKNQHFVPQSYLRGFIDLQYIPKEYSRDALWSINKNTKRIKMKGIRNICSNSYFYSHYDENQDFNYDIEQFLCYYETMFSKLSHKCTIIKEAVLAGTTFERITNVEKCFICEYILFQYFRVPKFVFSYIEEMIPGFREINAVNGVIQADDELINEIKKHGFKYMFNTESESFNYLKSIILSKNMEISIIPDDFGMDFITSDSPVLIANPTGPNALLSLYTEITLPLTNKLAISFVGIRSNDTYSVIKDRLQIATFNKSLLRNSFEYSFSGNPTRLSEIL